MYAWTRPNPWLIKLQRKYYIVSSIHIRAVLIFLSCVTERLLSRYVLTSPRSYRRGVEVDAWFPLHIGDNHHASMEDALFLVRNVWFLLPRMMPPGICTYIVIFSVTWLLDFLNSSETRNQSMKSNTWHALVLHLFCFRTGRKGSDTTLWLFSMHKKLQCNTRTLVWPWKL